MEQLQSLYRADSSDSLSNIMGMNYQPQLATSQMANTAVSSGMAAGAQIKATAMNNSTQMAIAGMNNNLAQQRLRMEQKQNTISNALNDDRFGLEVQKFGASEAGRIFGQQKDVATFNQNKAFQDGSLKLQGRNADTADKNAETARITANEPAAARAAKQKELDDAADADWTMWGQEADLVGGLMDQKIKDLQGISTQTVTLDNIEKIKQAKAELAKQELMRKNFGDRVTWARDQYGQKGRAFLGSFLKSHLGNVKTLRDFSGMGQPAQQQQQGTPQW